MTRIVFKLILMLALLIAIKLATKAVYGDEVSYHQTALLRRGYDTILIGTSRTQYGIMPAYLDALNGNKTKTYNFGISMGVLPHSIDWCEAAIRSQKSLRYILFELTGVGETTREYGEPWVEFRLEDYLNSMQSYSFQKASAYHDRIALNFLKPQLQVTRYFDNNIPLERIHEEYPLPVKKIDLGELSIAQRRNETVEKGDPMTAPQPDTLLWQRIAGLMKLADSAGIQIYFYIPPRLRTDSEMATMHRLWHKLDKRRRLQVDHAATSLYTLETSIDALHLNRRGAKQFTEKLAAAFHPQ